MRPTILIAVDDREVRGRLADHWAETLTVHSRTAGTSRELRATALFVMIGAVPHTEWLGPGFARDPDGYLLTGEEVAGLTQWSLVRGPLFLETCVPGVFAVGDVRHGATRRVAPRAGGAVSRCRCHRRTAIHQYLADAAQDGPSTS